MRTGRKVAAAFLIQSVGWILYAIRRERLRNILRRGTGITMTAWQLNSGIHPENSGSQRNIWNFWNGRRKPGLGIRRMAKYGSRTRNLLMLPADAAALS